MPTPDKPSLDYSYTAFSESQGDNSFPGTQLDNDLANLKASIDETIDFASQVIRDDGALQNGVVTKSSLGADILTGLAAPHPWATAMDYVVDETVTTDNGLYLCLVDHTSGVFATDYANGLWDQLAVWSPLTVVADNTISTSKIVNQAVTNGKLADNAVGTSKVADGAITRAKVSADFGLIPVGFPAEWDGPIAPAGWVFKFGQALSRTTYLALMNALTAVVTGNAAISNNTLTGVSIDLRNLGLEGAPIEGPGLQAGTTIVSIGINTIVLSQNATANATTSQYRIFPHGNGDGTTTFTLPDDRDRAAIGRGNMGGTAAGRVSNAGTGNPGLDTTKLSAAGGADRHTLTLPQAPAHNHGGSSGAAGGHSHTYTQPQLGAEGAAGTAKNVVIINGTAATSSVPDHTHSVASAGGGEAHPNVQPSRATNKIIFTGVV